MRIDKIAKRIYSGYIWMSDEDAPCRIDNEAYENALETGTVPFIIEAQLYDEEQKVSISVKYVDGQYIANEYSDVDAACANDKDVKLRTFIGNSRLGEYKLQFLQYWQEEEDVENLRCGMKELRPGKLVFIGFEK